MDPQITVITLGVSDLPRSVAFYRDGLRFPIKQGSAEEIAFFQAGGVILALFPDDELAADATVAPGGSGFRKFTLAHNVASPEAVDAILREAEQAGAKIVKPGQKVSWGGYSGYFSDPDGFLWEVVFSPFSKLKPDGTLDMK